MPKKNDKKASEYAQYLVVTKLLCTAVKQCVLITVLARVYLVIPAECCLSQIHSVYSVFFF